MKCSRRIRPIVSTTSIPHRPLHAKAGSRTNRKFGGQSWTPIPRLRGSFFHAGSHSKEQTDIRDDIRATEEVLAFITEAGAKSVVMTDQIIGCPHEEGIDYEIGR